LTAAFFDFDFGPDGFGNFAAVGRRHRGQTTSWRRGASQLTDPASAPRNRLRPVRRTA
jgi:hypothetical protein